MPLCPSPQSPVTHSESLSCTLRLGPLVLYLNISLPASPLGTPRPSGAHHQHILELFLQRPELAVPEGAPSLGEQTPGCYQSPWDDPGVSAWPFLPSTLSPTPLTRTCSVIFNPGIGGYWHSGVPVPRTTTGKTQRAQSRPMHVLPWEHQIT